MSTCVHTLLLSFTPAIKYTHVYINGRGVVEGAYLILEQSNYESRVVKMSTCVPTFSLSFTPTIKYTQIYKW